MTISLIAGIIVIAVALTWIICTARKQSRHLDKLHITDTDEEEK